MPITSIAKQIKDKKPLLTLTEKISEFHGKLRLTAVQQQRISTLTMGQSATSEWSKFRAGLIIATKLLAVVRKYDSDMTVKNVESAKNLAVDILQYNPPSSNKAMRWGISNEPIAREQYRRIMNQFFYKNFKVKETGLIVSTEHPFTGASPDALVSCSCCGQGVAEFKVPWTYRDKPVIELKDNRHMFGVN